MDARRNKPVPSHVQSLSAAFGPTNGGGIAMNRSSLRALSSAACLAAACLVFSGCVSYSPSQLSAMNTVDLCELREVQGPNLSPDTRNAMQGELSRRGESCTTHNAALAERREAFLYREIYGKSDNP
jgi:hypothetical protein